MATGYTEQQKRQLADSIMNGGGSSGGSLQAMQAPPSNLPDTIRGKNVIKSSVLHTPEEETGTNAVNYAGDVASAINDFAALPKNAEAAAPTPSIPQQSQGNQLEETPEQQVQDQQAEIDSAQAQLAEQQSQATDQEEQGETTPDNETFEQQQHNLDLDDDEIEANTYGDPEDVQNEDPEIANQVVTHIAETDQFQSPEQAQAALNLYATSPSGQQFIRTSPTELVLQTALGRELQKLAEQHTIVPETPNPNVAKQPFQQGTGVYVDPVSGRPVSRPGFFKRLGNAIKYALGIGDMYETQPMLGTAQQGQPQQPMSNPQQQGLQTAQAFSAFNGLGGIQGMGQQGMQAPPPIQTGNAQADVQRILQGGAGGQVGMGAQTQGIPGQQPQGQQLPPYMMPQNLQAFNQGAPNQMQQGNPQGGVPAITNMRNMPWDIPSVRGQQPVYNPYSPFDNIQ